MTRLVPLALTFTLACAPASPDRVTAPPPTAPAPATPDSVAGWTTTDVMPDWWTFWDRAADLPRAEQHALFSELVVSRHPALFGEAVLSLDLTAPFELAPRVETFLDAVPPLVPTMRRFSDQLDAELPRNRETFTAAFPDFAWRGTVYFTVSLLAFDGAVREVDGAESLVFGLDKIAQIHAQIHGDSDSLAPLFHHELFHVYHFGTHTPFGPGPNRLYHALWAEGLAVWVSRELNPDAKLEDILVTPELVAAADAMMPALAHELL